MVTSILNIQKPNPATTTSQIFEHVVAKLARRAWQNFYQQSLPLTNRNLQGTSSRNSQQASDFSGNPREMVRTRSSGPASLNSGASRTQGTRTTNRRQSTQELPPPESATSGRGSVTRQASSSTEEGFSEGSVQSLVPDQAISSTTAVPPIVSPSSRTKSSARTNKRGLAESILEQLASDAEDRGGLFFLLTQKDYLKQFCAGKEDVYGQPGSKVREQVRNKLQRWGRLSPLEYRDVLLSFKILPSKSTQELCGAQNTEPLASQRTEPKQLDVVPSVVQVQGKSASVSTSSSIGSYGDFHSYREPKNPTEFEEEKPKSSFLIMSHQVVAQTKVEIINGVVTGKMS